MNGLASSSHQTPHYRSVDDKDARQTKDPCPATQEPEKTVYLGVYRIMPNHTERHLPVSCFLQDLARYVVLYEQQAAREERRRDRETRLQDLQHQTEQSYLFLKQVNAFREANIHQTAIETLQDEEELADTILRGQVWEARGGDYIVLCGSATNTLGAHGVIAKNGVCALHSALLPVKDLAGLTLWVQGHFMASLADANMRYVGCYNQVYGSFQIYLDNYKAVMEVSIGPLLNIGLYESIWWWNFGSLPSFLDVLPPYAWVHFETASFPVLPETQVGNI